MNDCLPLKREIAADTGLITAITAKRSLEPDTIVLDITIEALKTENDNTFYPGPARGETSRTYYIAISLEPQSPPISAKIARPPSQQRISELCNILFQPRELFLPFSGM